MQTGKKIQGDDYFKGEAQQAHVNEHQDRNKRSYLTCLKGIVWLKREWGL